MVVGCHLAPIQGRQEGLVYRLSKPLPDREAGVRLTPMVLAAHMFPRLCDALLGQSERRVLRAFVRRGLLEPGAARDMRGWGAGGGFSVDRSIRVEAHDRLGLERWLAPLCEPPLLLSAAGQKRNRPSTSGWNTASITQQ
jgi:hypothetical protein